MGDIADAIYGPLAPNWRMVRLKTLVEDGVAELQTGPFGTMLHASAYQTTGTPVIAVQHIGENSLRQGEYPLVDDDTTARLSRYKVRENDILFGRKGAVDRRALIRHHESGWLQGSDCIRLRFNETIDARYISYVLGTSAYKQWIMRHAHGATMPSLNQEILGLIPLPLPSLPEQKRIAHILGTLDDKIELNRRMNATLEAMARALFKSWFTDFDPVRWNMNRATGKSKGRNQPSPPAPLPAVEGRAFGLDSETAALFPSEFQESPMGPIPKGWTVEPVGEVVACVGGSTPSTSEPKYWEGGTHHWTTPKDFSSLQSPFLIDTDRKITDAGVSEISSGLLPAGTLLLSSRAPVGYLSIATKPVAINQGFIALKCNECASNYFMLNWCQENMAEIESRATGTTFAEISKSNFRPISVVLPNKDLMVAFTNKVSPLYAQVVENLLQSRTLATLRDTLLPKLLSGTHVEAGDSQHRRVKH